MKSERSAHSFNSLADNDVLTTSLFHKVLVAFNWPSTWPGWLVIVAAAVVAILTGWWWGWLSANPVTGLAIAALQFAFFAGDALLLQRLPRFRLSFGPWGGQFFALLLPRMAATFVLGLFGLWISWLVALFVWVGCQLIGTIALYRGAVAEPSELGLSRLQVACPQLDRVNNPLKLLHISDLHIERLGIREDRLLELVDQAGADLIVITGDYVNLSFNIDPTTHEQVRQLLAKLAAPLGVFAVLGSPPVDLHDTIPPLFEGLPVRLLRNESVAIQMDGQRSLTLVGMDCHHDIARDTATLDRIMSTTDGNGPRVLLYHSPELMPQAVRWGIDLYVCGHTHGGQVRLPIIGPVVTSSRLGRRYVMGHYHEDQTHLYVSRGVGFEGLGAPRVRLLCPPEITLITMTAQSQAG